MSEGYILNALQTPAVLRPVYESVRSGHVTTDEIKSDTGLASDPVDQGTTGLRYCRLLGKDDGKFRTADPKWDLEDDQLAFRMGILHNLTQECTAGDWGKQAVVLLNYQYLLQDDLQYFKSDDQVVYQSMNEWHRTEKDYVPMSKQGEIDLNKTKFVNWSRIATYLGLVYKASGREHTVYPDPSLIRTSLSLAAAERGADSRIGIATYIGWLQDNLLPVELTTDGDVPPILSRVLFNLVRDGDIELVEHGDAGAVSLSRTPNREGISLDANTIEVIAE